ncbi:hypothetical protein GCM10027612_63980 [Microbispora bryophytorum subsp. camponoti]
MSTGRVIVEGADVHSLPEGIELLARLLGDVVADYENEHERWRLYEKALDHADPSVRKALEAAILQEEDENVALSVVLRVLERAPRSERTAWINRLSGSRSREYARARATDMATLEDLVRNVLPAGEGAYALRSRIGLIGSSSGSPRRASAQIS